jgi:hypothetical protein
MRKQHVSEMRGWDRAAPGVEHRFNPRVARTGAVDRNSPEDIFGEIGLVLIVVLGVVLAVNLIVGALHLA